MPDPIWLADVLRNAGCKVWEDPAWLRRGHGDMGNIIGVIAHHTAGGGSNDWRVVRDGRPGLSGPLAQLTLEHDGTFRVLAAGISWHAGRMWHEDLPGGSNRNLIGIEGVSSGRWGDWTSAQMEEYPRGVAAILRRLGLPASRCLGHKEIATPRGRKIDPSFDMHDFRAAVARHLRGAAPSPSSPNRLVDEMPAGTLPPGKHVTKLTYPIGPSVSRLVAAGWLSLASSEDATARVWTQGKGGDAYETWDPVTLTKDKRWWAQLPDGVDQVTLHTDSPGSVGWCLELQPR